MQESKFIDKGYFPKELPPPFYTSKLAEKLSDIKNRWIAFEIIETDRTTNGIKESKSDWNSKKDSFYSKYGSSKCCNFSISKGKLSRRVLKIPNPKHFIPVVELICDKWDEINKIYALSKFSTSFPIEESNPNKRAVKTKSTSVQALRDTIIETSINKLIQVKIDISKFYPTIYTHIISWSLLGKDVAKKYYKKSKNELDTLIKSGDTNAILYKYADKLDSAIRACQDRQSIGIPIGPDTSHIIAEFIACRIDEEFKNKFDSINVEAVRYYDDYYIYVNTKDEADLVIKGFQKILNEFQLEINDKKVDIEEFPFLFENEWVTDLYQFEFRKTNQSNSLKHYFSLIWGIGEKNSSRTDWVFKYALKTFEFGTIIIKKESWKLFENLLLKTALIQPAVLDIITRIFLMYEIYVNNNSKEKLKNLIEHVISMHSPVNHNFETAWALWLAKSFKIKIKEELANQIIETNDSISILILLSLAKVENLVEGSPNFSSLENELKGDILLSETWLLAYEAVKKGWLTPSDTNLISKNGFFQILSDLNIDFFDCSRQLLIYETIDNDVNKKLNTKSKEELNEPDDYNTSTKLIVETRSESQQTNMEPWQFY
jgi:hypothetical protein